MISYYNEIDPYAADWLRTLILVGLIAPGDVDTRSIEDVTPNDLHGYDQCHFFAGIGGWSLALRLAGWPDDRPVWTGSCPCQPFSAAGKGKGTADERHLWPAWHWLIDQCRPGVIFGEQVEAATRHGWLDLVQADLENLGYAFGAVGLPAAGVGAPHGRARLWFVADDEARRRREVDPIGRRRDEGVRAQGGERLDRGGMLGELADDDETGRRLERGARLPDGERPAQRDYTDRRGTIGELGDPDAARPQGRGERGDSTDQCAVGSASVAVGMANPDGGNPGTEGIQRSREHGQQSEDRLLSLGDHRPDATNGYWRSADWLTCRDMRWRPVEPGTFPLAHGVPARVGRLRAYGNAIVPQVAEAFIRSFCELRGAK